MGSDSFTMVLKSARMLTPRVRELTFVREDGQPFSYIPGQFITMHLPWESATLRRNYSIATMNREPAEIQIAAVFVEGGRATRLLFAMDPGERVETTGPFGRFILRDESPARYVLVATGTGVTPYRAMLPELADRIDHSGFSAILLLGVRSPKELVYGEDFLSFADRHPGFRFLACYSREMPASPSALERPGYVQDNLYQLSLDLETDIVYLCGNPNMIDIAAQSLKADGFPIARIRREKYVSAN